MDEEYHRLSSLCTTGKEGESRETVLKWDENLFAWQPNQHKPLLNRLGPSCRKGGNGPGGTEQGQDLDSEVCVKFRFE